MGEWHHLIHSAQKGDVDAFGDIVREFQGMAVGYAFSILGDFEQAEDAAQEAFLQAYHDLHTLLEWQAFPAWLQRLVFKHCDRQMRRKRLRTVPIEAALETASKGPNPMQAMEQSELRQRVLEAIYSLPEHERSAVSLFYINGYSQAEVGEFLDVPAKTVKSRLHSARRKLRERMKDMVEDTLKKSAPDDHFAQRVVTLVRENLTLADTGCPSGKRAQPGFFSIFADSRPVAGSSPLRMAGMSWRVLIPDGSGRCQPDSEAS